MGWRQGNWGEGQIIWREEENEGERTAALSALEQHGSVEKGSRTERKRVTINSRPGNKLYEKKSYIPIVLNSFPTILDRHKSFDMKVRKYSQGRHLSTVFIFDCIAGTERQWVWEIENLWQRKKPHRNAISSRPEWIRRPRWREGGKKRERRNK